MILTMMIKKMNPMNNLLKAKKIMMNLTNNFNSNEKDNNESNK